MNDLYNVTVREEVVLGDNKTVKLIPLFTVMCIIPLLVQIVVTDSGLSAYDWFSKKSTEYDFFLIYKMYGIMVIAGIMLVMLISGFVRKRYPLNNISGNKVIFIPLLAYAAAAVVSSVYAHDMNAAFFGGYAQHEPVTVLISYVIIFTYTYYILDNENSVITFVKMIIPGIAIMALSGVCQRFNADFLTSYAGKWLISAFSSIEPSQISASFEAGRVYMTLYNPDYAGVYAALILPLCAAGIFAVKRLWFRILSACVSVMLVICLFGSRSETGLYVCIAEAVMVFAICIFIYRKRLGRIIIAVSALAGLAIIISALAGSITRRSVYPLEYMDVEERGVKICIMGEAINISSSISDAGIDIKVSDDSMNIIETDRQGNVITFKDPQKAYEGLRIETETAEDGLRGFSVIYGDIRLFFTNDNSQGKYYYRNVYGKYTDDISNIKRNVLSFKETVASHRGYIWSGTIPLIKDNIFYGCGPDNFVYEFPNNDYLSLLNNGYSGKVVTRPHNMYLQTGVQTGLISLVMICILYAVYLMRSICMIRRLERLTPVNIISIAVFSGSAGYMVCGLANDSSVCTAPLFWVILAAGFCCNNIIKRTGEISDGTYNKFSD